MLNGFGVCHGGATFALAEQRAGVRVEHRRQVTVSIENSITYPASVAAGDVLTAIATEESRRTGSHLFGAGLTKQDESVVALFRGTVYRTRLAHRPDERPESGRTRQEMAEAYIVDGVRTPIGSFGGALSEVRPDDLAAHATRSLERHPRSTAPRSHGARMRQPGRGGQQKRRAHGQPLAACRPRSPARR